jgi:hypothetical protein
MSGAVAPRRSPITRDRPAALSGTMASTAMSIHLQCECTSPRRSTPAAPSPRARADAPRPARPLARPARPASNPSRSRASAPAKDNCSTGAASSPLRIGMVELRAGFSGRPSCRGGARACEPAGFGPVL